VLRSLQETPSCFCEYRFVSLGLEILGFGGAYFVEGRVHFRNDMITVKHVQCSRGLFRYDIEIGLPHVAADELERFTPLCAERSEELLQGFFRPFPPNP